MIRVLEHKLEKRSPSGDRNQSPEDYHDFRQLDSESEDDKEEEEATTKRSPSVSIAEQVSISNLKPGSQLGDQLGVDSQP